MLNNYFIYDLFRNNYMSQSQNSKTIIDQIATKEKTKNQNQTLRIILSYLPHGKFIPNDIIDTIATFTYPNPIIFLNPVFIQTENRNLKKKRAVMFRPFGQEYLIKIKIANIWKRCKQCQLDDLMQKGSYFIQFMSPLRIVEQPEYDSFSQSYKKEQKLLWSSNKCQVSIRSSNDFLTKAHLKQLKKYQQKKVMSISIKRALYYLMNCDIIIIEYYNNQKKEIIFQNQQQEHDNKYIQCIQGEWRLKQCQEVWKKFAKVTKRGELEIMDQSGNSYNMLDYHIFSE